MQPDAPMGKEARLMQIADQMRAMADEVERLAASIIVEKADDAAWDKRFAATRPQLDALAQRALLEHRCHTQSTVAYSAPVEIVSRATATHAVAMPRGIPCCDTAADQP